MDTVVASLTSRAMQTPLPDILGGLRGCLAALPLYPWPPQELRGPSVHLLSSFPKIARTAQLDCCGVRPVAGAWSPPPTLRSPDAAH